MKKVIVIFCFIVFGISNGFADENMRDTFEKSAEERLLSFEAAEYQLMISEAKELIKKYEDYDREAFETRVVITEDFPEKLSFMNLDTIYLLEDSCELLLHNGIGKDIGYSISRDESGKFEIKSFNHHVSWDSSKITKTNL